MEEKKALPTKVSLLLGALICIGAVFITFGFSINDGFLMFDDPYLVVNNLAAHGPTIAHIKTAFTSYDPELYIPLTLVSYQINYLFAGLNPQMYHITNLLLHGMNAFLFGLILFLLIRRRKLALLFALMYAVHPLNTEAAVWIAARKDTLSTFFLFGSIVAYLRSFEDNSKKLYRWSIGLYVLAALAKASVFTLPLLLPLLRLLQEPREFSVKKSLKSLAPFFLIGLITAGIAFAGKSRVIESSSLLETILMAAKSTIFYLEKIFWPSSLTSIYPYTKEISALSPDFFIPSLLLIGIVAMAVASLRWSAWPTICLLLFLVTLGPSYFNFHKGTAMFFAVDRYAYVAMAWVILLCAKATEYLCAKYANACKYVYIGSCIAVLIFSALSMRQTLHWNDDEAVFGNALKHYPESVTARVSLAVWYRQSGRIKDELQILEEGLSYSRDTALLLEIGSIHVRQGEVEKGEKLFREAMENDPKNPEPYFYLGSLDEERGLTEEAAVKYRKAIELDESYVAAYNNLGAIYLDKRESIDAEKLFREAIYWNPNFMEGRMNLFQALEMQGKKDEAFEHLQIAYELDSENPDILIDYGYRLSERGYEKKAIQVLEHLMRISPNNRVGERTLRRLKPSWDPESFPAKQTQQQYLAPL